MATAQAPTTPTTVPSTGALQVTIETTLLPPFTVGLLEAGRAITVPPSLAIRVLKPRITIRAGPVVLGVIQPAGPPGATKFPFVVVGVVALVALWFTRKVLK